MSQGHTEGLTAIQMSQQMYGWIQTDVWTCGQVKRQTNVWTYVQTYAHTNVLIGMVHVGRLGWSGLQGL